MTETCQDTDDPVEQFKELLPRRNVERLIERISEASRGRVVIKFNPSYTLAPSTLRPLLAEGWMPTRHKRVGDQNKFYFSRYDVEEREVERTVTETEQHITFER